MARLRSMQAEKNGFTLLELLVALAVFAIAVSTAE
jgi:prepilin-type N-terminal cleavage/methylation domain-containing protein